MKTRGVKGPIVTEWKTVSLSIGFCGGMTTFSAVTIEVVIPDSSGFIYLALTIVSSLAVAHLAMVTSRKIIKERQI